MPAWINIVVALGAMIISAVIGLFLIPLLKRLHCGATILEIGPAWHKDKAGTPLMGGFMFIIGSLVAMTVGLAILYQMNGEGSIGMNIVFGVIMALANSFIGFLDDYIKAVKKRNLGLKSKQKMALQVVITALYLFAMRMWGGLSTVITIPFAGDVDFGVFYYPLMMLYIIFLVNAVNLTDGVDGLCGSVTTVMALSVMMIAMQYGAFDNSILSAAVAGGCLGFLVWNLHPAKTFMGDTGSMYLGGMFVAMTITIPTWTVWVMALLGIIYVVEALSVVLQVISFKTTGKRIFKMSPIHHHFEKSGWGEYKIVIIFSLITLVAGIIANVIVHNSYFLM